MADRLVEMGAHALPWGIDNILKAGTPEAEDVSNKIAYMHIYT